MAPNDFSIPLACNDTMTESQPFPRITSVAERWSKGNPSGVGTDVHPKSGEGKKFLSEYHTKICQLI
jgi:hypothetical protein